MSDCYYDVKLVVGHSYTLSLLGRSGRGIEQFCFGSTYLQLNPNYRRLERADPLTWKKEGISAVWSGARGLRKSCCKVSRVTGHVSRVTLCWCRCAARSGCAAGAGGRSASAAAAWCAAATTGWWCWPASRGTRRRGRGGWTTRRWRWCWSAASPPTSCSAGTPASPGPSCTPAGTPSCR